MRVNISNLRLYGAALLWCTGGSLLACCALVWGYAALEQTRGTAELRELSERGATFGGTRPEGALVGRVEIPRLKVSAIVFEGTSTSTLAKGVGHWSASQLPGGGQGNVVLAAHRDTFFRPLEGIRPSDVVSLQTPQGTVKYFVEEVKVVSPGAVEMLKPDGPARLTLITCYPFSYLGSAPQRFVVRASPILRPGH